MRPLPVKQLREDRAIAGESAFSRGALRVSRPKSAVRRMPGLQGQQPKPLNIVMICHYGRTGYNILRSLRALGARVYLVHDRRSASLRFSRCCEVLHASGDLPLTDPNVVLSIINNLHLEVGIDSVIASDVESLAFLSRIKDRLLAPVFPICEASTLVTLNDKWEFYKLCEVAGVAVPKSLSFDSKSESDLDTIQRELGFPTIVKPIASYGQRGITVLRDRVQAEEWQRSREAHGHPVIVQEYIEGRDWALSVFAQDGVIKHWVSWVCPSQLDSGYGIGRFLATEFIPRDDLLAMAQRVIAATHFSGVANFDARYDDRAGAMKMLECNPRFFNRMSAARLSGLDFVRPGLPVGGAQPVTLGSVSYYPWQELFSKRGLQRIISGKWRLTPLLHDIYEMSTDPLPPIVRKWSREDDRD